MGLFVFYLGCRSIILAESTYPSQIIYNINIYHYAKPVHHVLSFLPISSHCIFIRPLSLSSVCFYTLQHMSSFILYPVLLFPLFISFYVHFSSSQALSISTVLVSLLFHLSIKVFLLRLFSVCSAFCCTLSLMLVFSHFPGFVDLDFAVPISLQLFMYVISVLFMFYIL